jgi:uncharacterized protein (DUF1499 family)
MRFVIKLVCVAAIALALAIAAAGPGTRLGFWDYGFGLTLIRQAALPVLIAAGLALIGSLIAFVSKDAKAGILALAAGLIAAGAAAVPLKMRADFKANPFIHEVTTDFDDPPAIIAAADMPRTNPPEYRGDDAVPQSAAQQTVAEAQRAAFPDIAPIRTERDLKACADIAKAVIADMGMEVLADGPADDSAGGGWRIEAVATSAWFGFKDDFIVRLTPVDGGGTRIDIRSKSRVGGSDLGANAKRVREFTKRFNAAA